MSDPRYFDSLHPFDQAISLADDDSGVVIGHTHPDYWNQVGPFSGITAAIVLQSILRHPQRLGDPVALTVNYAGRTAEGRFELRVTPVRTNRGTQHWTVQQLQGEHDTVMVSATAIFAVRRPTWEQRTVAPPEAPAAGEVPRVAGPSHVRWPQRYDMRPVRGFPMQHNRDSTSVGWVADLPARALDFASLASICDLFLPRPFLMRAKVVPVSTVSMNIYFHVDAATLARQQARPVLIDARGQISHAGFFDHEGRVWGDDSTLLATTQQMAWFKE